MGNLSGERRKQMLCLPPRQVAPGDVYPLQRLRFAQDREVVLMRIRSVVRGMLVSYKVTLPPSSFTPRRS